MGRISGAMMRCAVLLTGMNSVSPCTTPNTSDCGTFNVEFLERYRGRGRLRGQPAAFTRPHVEIVEKHTHHRRHRRRQEHSPHSEELGTDEQHDDYDGGVQLDAVTD